MSTSLKCHFFLLLPKFKTVHVMPLERTWECFHNILSTIVFKDFWKKYYISFRMHLNLLQIKNMLLLEVVLFYFEVSCLSANSLIDLKWIQFLISCFIIAHKILNSALHVIIPWFPFYPDWMPNTIKSYCAQKWKDFIFEKKKILAIIRTLLSEIIPHLRKWQSFG